MAKGKEKQGKKERKPRRPSKLYELYKISGDKFEKRPSSCPKCGKGVSLAVHKNRRVCGKCSYTEFTKVASA